MSIKKIKKNNSQKFLDDLKRVSDVMVYAELTKSYLKTTKKEVLSEAEYKHIRYYMTDVVFKNRRDVMVIS